MPGWPPFFPASSGFGSPGQTRIEVGRPIRQIVGFAFDANRNRDSTISQLGNSAPEFRVGSANDIAWRAFSLNTVLDWQKGGDVINLTLFLQDDGRTSEDWGTAEWEDRYEGYRRA